MRRRLSPRDSAKILGWPDGGERMRPPGPSPSPSPFRLPRSGLWHHSIRRLATSRARPGAVRRPGIVGHRAGVWPGGPAGGQAASESDLA